LYVVHHGFRESIEVFDIDAQTKTPTLAWRGCILAPKGVNFNGVAPLPNGGIVTTRTFRTGVSEMMLGAEGQDIGEVYEWHSRDGWKVVPGSASPGPNGIEVSPDGQWLYVALWPFKKIMRLSRGRAQVEKTVLDVSFHPDNLRWQADGSLLTGGAYAPTRDDMMPCMEKVCKGAAARVARIDPRTLKVEEIVNYPSEDVFFAATAAVQVGREIWIGSTQGDRLARYPIR
jgi:sugar lactone lactonase YvrE